MTTTKIVSSPGTEAYELKETAMTTTKYPITVKLVGEDGNAMAIMAKVSRALRNAGATREEVNEYMDESMSGDYDNLLRVAMTWVEIE